MTSHDYIYLSHAPHTATPYIEQAPPPQTQVDLGQTVIFRCSIREISDVTVSYQWRRETQVLEGATSGALTIEDIGMGDSGGYECTALLSVGRVSAPPLSFSVSSFSVTIGCKSVSEFDSQPTYQSVQYSCIVHTHLHTHSHSHTHSYTCTHPHSSA